MNFVQYAASTRRWGGGRTFSYSSVARRAVYRQPLFGTQSWHNASRTRLQSEGKTRFEWRNKTADSLSGCRFDPAGLDGERGHARPGGWEDQWGGAACFPRVALYLFHPKVRAVSARETGRRRRDAPPVRSLTRGRGIGMAVCPTPALGGPTAPRPPPLQPRGPGHFPRSMGRLGRLDRE